MKAPLSLQRRLWGWLSACFLVPFLFGSLILINVTQMLSVGLIPVAKRTFRAYNRFAANLWWGWTVTLSRLFHGVKVELTGDEVASRENAIIVSNHQQMSDITFLFFLARAKDRLGDLKWFVKDILKYVPGIGWGMVFLGCIFVKRDWTKDKISIEQTFATINKEQVPYWTMIFPEGTRLTPKKLVKSKAIAAKKGIAPTDHVLLPRPKGFAASVQGLRLGQLKAVYDITIGYPEGVPSLWQYIQGYAKVAHIHVQRFAVEDLPTSAEKLEDWLFNRFQEKERLLEAFYRDGAFPADDPARVL